MDVEYVNQSSYLLGIHRSGWAYVVEQLKTLQSSAGIRCDAFVDRTFLFNTDPHLRALLPYTVPWIGFVHHPFDSINSSNDSGALSQNADFAASLPTCKALFVFGADMKAKWRATLNALGHDKTRVFSVVHPTEPPPVTFTMDKLLANAAPLIVQVGAHLRNTYSIYALNRGTSAVGALKLRKAALVGPDMGSYYGARYLFDYLQAAVPRRGDAPQGVENPVIPVSDQHITNVNATLPQVLLSAATRNLAQDFNKALHQTGTICRDSANSVYITGALKVLKEYDQSVALVPTLSNAAYDTLLSENVVFLELYDSATTGINTVLECIVRANPLVVNRINATTELLGADYPLFFDSIDDVPGLLTTERIAAAHDYLRTMIKDAFTGAYFIRSVLDALAIAG